MEYVINTKDYENELNLINFTLTKFLMNFGLKPKLEECFRYNSNTGEVYYELDFGGYSARTQDGNRDFFNSVKRQNPKVKLNLFIWQLLHEVGHHYTLFTFTKKEIMRGRKKVYRLAHNCATNPYYTIPYEVAATKWAVEYANTHQKEIKEFWNELEPVVKALEEKVASI